METPFQALEVVNVVQTKRKSAGEPKMVISSWKNVKEAIEVACSRSWGIIIELLEKNDQFGMKYQSSFEQIKDQKIHQGEVPRIQ